MREHVVPDVAGRDVLGPDTLAAQRRLEKARDDRYGVRIDADGLNGAHPTRLSTVSMHWVDPLDPDPNQITLEDIAHALSRSCRYNGHVTGFLSVARHSIWVSQRVDGGPLLKLTALMHDAAEAYVGDMIRPLKHRPEMAIYREAEDRVTHAIAQRFGLIDPLPPEVVEADRLVLVDLELPNARWSWSTTPDRDKIDFLERYVHLRSQVPTHTIVLPASPEGEVTEVHH